ncbi:hypothetical protein AOQ84DRAFT_146294 [Glonium stellatum]|uniref:Uncharacterized protein n=1 Tax=Glonium stellatum TaxID=574774 RepID=A0A8E2F9Y7_9PEZI|nr:hypothetical protein AOQ84DRAFT_146294 [Glonium stellatum]
MCLPFRGHAKRYDGLLSRFYRAGVDWAPSYEFITPPVHFLLRTITENPSLSMSIKSLGFTGWIKSVYHNAPGTLWKAGSEPELTGSELNAMKHLVRTTKLPEEKLWFSALGKGDVNAFVALLLSQLTELRRLHLGPDYYKENEFLHLLLSRALCPRDPTSELPMFLHLEHVCISPAAEGKQLGKSYNYKSDIYYLLHLPAVRTLDVELALERVVEDFQFSWFHSKPLTTSNLTALALRTHKIPDVAVLQAILAATPNLRTLHYEFGGFFDTNFVGYNPATDIREVNFDFGKFSHALRHIQKTLKKLKFVVSVLDLFMPFDEEPPWEWKIRKASFRDLSMLEDLTIPFVGYFGCGSHLTESPLEIWSGLPRSIRHLRFTEGLGEASAFLWCPERCLDLLETSLQDWKSFTPDLQCLDIELKKDTVKRWTQRNPGWQEELGLICERAKLSCNIEYERLTKNIYYVQ